MVLVAINILSSALWAFGNKIQQQMKNLAILSILLFCCFACAAFTGSTSLSPVAVEVAQSTTNPFTDFDNAGILALILVFLEAVVRIFPTSKNLSFIHLAIRIISIVVPNRRKIKLENGKEKRCLFKIKEGGNPLKKSEDVQEITTGVSE